MSKSSVKKADAVRLQPLRMCTGWTVAWNIFHEIDPPPDPNAREWFFFSEDLLLLSNRRVRVLIDVSWRPYGKRGRFYLTVVDWAGDDEMPDKWDKPLDQFASRSREKIVERLDHLLAEEFNWTTFKKAGRKKKRNFTKRPLSYVQTQKLFESEVDSA